MSWLRQASAEEDEEKGVTDAWSPREAPPPDPAIPASPLDLPPPGPTRRLFGDRPVQVPAEVVLPDPVVQAASLTPDPVQEAASPPDLVQEAASLPDPAPPAPPAPLVQLEPVKEGELSFEQVRNAVPQHLRAAVTPHFVGQVNNLVQDPIAAEAMRENFLSFSKVLQDGRFTTEQYLHAVAYVSFKLMGLSNKDAYARAFPTRYAKLLADGRSEKEISSYVAMFHKNKLVGKLLEQSLTPSWVLNQDAYQKAINVQVELMTDPDQRGDVRTKAADSLLNHLKPPEPGKNALKVELNEGAGLKELRQQMSELAELTRKQIQEGRLKTVDVAAQRLVSREAEDV